ncbi:phosphate acyltransferase PlsX [Mycoplasmopsis alligatoris]|uniref:Phosphate acyltransferase n=1 Tax=Mycoplasmopsis alligatoris A21JP2 TaxID=747682 RepID=D4XWC3_9BACT|nr:phosphate acyltransferase PlsX [Mycoplasmopsis alligatoris]EFF41112.1 fatty acid/phospholipid synthesis protein PlsX [Mycoplasmopsis alligatoris A21JP2]
MNQYKIAFDFSGSDHGVVPVVEAANEFLEKNPNFKLILVGKKADLDSSYNGAIHKNIEIVDKPIYPSNIKNIKQSLSEDTAMNHAFNLVKTNQANAIMSAGDSGLYLGSATLILKRLQGISRPAFMPLMPTTKGKKFLLLDVGANITTKANYLVEWSIIANEYAKVLLDLTNPRISLLNIGTEDYKGTEEVKEAHQLLKNEKINYIGFQEPRNILNWTTDVAVIDGYGGNLVLKSLEGAILSFKDLIKGKIMLKTIRKIGYLFLKGAFKDVAETLDYRNVGAAWVIGVDGVVIKCHGSSDKKSYIGAFNQVKLALEKNVLSYVKESLDQKNKAVIND